MNSLDWSHVTIKKKLTGDAFPLHCFLKCHWYRGGVYGVPVLHTFVDGIRSFVEHFSCQPLFGGWQDLELVYMQPCIPRIVVWLSWIMWAISCSQMQKVLWVRELMSSVCPNQAYTHDCCARPFTLWRGDWAPQQVVGEWPSEIVNLLSQNILISVLGISKFKPSTKRLI